MSASPRMLIENARPTDADWIADFQVLMADESEGMKLDRATVGAGVSHIFSHPELGFYLVVRAADGTPIACTLVQNEWSDWRNRRVLWIHSLYVIPAERKSGVFRAIYAYLRDRVETEASLGGLRLYVDRRNSTAQAAYSRVGMTNEHYELYEWMKT